LGKGLIKERKGEGGREIEKKRIDIGWCEETFTLSSTTLSHSENKQIIYWGVCVLGEKV
jgi:hypothetical protein